MEKLPLSNKAHQLSSSYESISSVDSVKTQDGSSAGASEDGSSPWASRIKRMMSWKRRHSSEGSFIYITGTGTVLEESLTCEDEHKDLTKFPSKEDSSEMDDLPPGIGQYDDFHTIDWQRDLARDRYRHRYINRKMGESTMSLIKGYYDKVSRWICVFLVGVAAGSIAGVIDIGEGWMKDLKEGICPQAFWLNKEQCCWSSNETFYEGDECDQWSSWIRIFDLRSSPSLSYAMTFLFYTAWSLFFSLLACTMVKTLAPYACGSGIPEIKTILSGFIMRGYLGKWTLIVKSLCMMLVVASGLSLGKEGPMVHIVCCIGNIFSYLFPKYGKNEAKKREILSAASAAGVSVAFGSPIGGVLFSLEEVSYYFPMKTLWRSFFCALVAAFVLRSIDPLGTDHIVKYYVSSTRAWILIELIPFVGLGILGGIIGTTFIRGNIAWCRYRKHSKLGKFPITEVLVVTLVTTLISFPNDFARMDSSDLIKTLFSDCAFREDSLLCDYKRNVTSFDINPPIVGVGPGILKSLYLLILTLLCKWVITVFTFGMKIPAGLFIPSMAMGAIMGRIIGVGVQQLALSYQNSWPFHATCASNEECMAPGLYAMLGAAACLAGVTRMTVSLVVIMFELTGSVDYIVPLMATVVTSKWVSDAIGKGGIYDAHIRLNQYPHLDNKEHFKHSTRVGDITRNHETKANNLCCLKGEGMTIKELEQLLEATKYNGFPVVISDENPYLIGFVLRRDLYLALVHFKNKKENLSHKSIIDFTENAADNVIDTPSLINFSAIVDMAPPTVTIRTPMETVIEMFCRLGLRQILITNHGMLVDIVTKKDVLSHIEEKNEKMRKRKIYS